MPQRIGLIAGSGPFPLIFAEKAREKGYQVVAVGYHNETDPSLADFVDAIEILYIGQLGRLIKFFRHHQSTDAAMIGAVKKPGSIKEIRPDFKTISLYAGMRGNTHDDRMLRAFADVLADAGIRICSSTFLLPEFLAKQGCWTRRKPSKDEQMDIELGWKMAKGIGRLDIGQCVVVSNGSVLAVEAIDGTDSTIRRGGQLGKGRAVVVKVCKPNQDFRFDVPAVGTRTIRIMHESGVSALAIEAGRSLVFQPSEMTSLADQFGISIVALEDLPGE